MSVSQESFSSSHITLIDGAYMQPRICDLGSNTSTLFPHKLHVLRPISSNQMSIPAGSYQ
eukprot:2763353-Amphidinium_carterae.3